MAYQIFDNFVTASLYRKGKYSSDEHSVVGFSWECGNGGQLLEANEEKVKEQQNKTNELEEARLQTSVQLES